MARFTHFFSGKFQYFEKCASVKHLTNIMSASRLQQFTFIEKKCLLCPVSSYPAKLCRWHIWQFILETFASVEAFKNAKCTFTK